MDVYNAIKKRRSIRRFREKKVSEKTLEKCIDAARLSPTGANKQPLKFITIKEELENVFQYTNWAGYIDWNPSEKEMPRAYIAITKHAKKGSKIDIGIAAQSICLTALNEGLGSCMLGAIDKKNLTRILPIPKNHELELLIGLGYPNENPKIIENPKKIEYYKENNDLVVPKKPIEEVWIKRNKDD